MIEYQAVSMAVILRDYTENLPYINDEHKRLTDIADTLYNANIPVENWNNNPEFNYKELYNRYGKEFWDLVLKDVGAIDSQVNQYNIEDLKLDYRDTIEQAK